MGKWDYCSWAGQKSSGWLFYIHIKSIALLQSLAFRHVFVQKNYCLAQISHSCRVSMWHSSHFQPNPSRDSSQSALHPAAFYLKLSGSSTCGWSSSGRWAPFWRASGWPAGGAQSPGGRSGPWASWVICSGPLDRCSIFSKSSM